MYCHCIKLPQVFQCKVLNEFMGLGRAAWTEARTTLQSILSKDNVSHQKQKICIALFYNNIICSLCWEIMQNWGRSKSFSQETKTFMCACVVDVSSQEPALPCTFQLVLVSAVPPPRHGWWGLAHPLWLCRGFHWFLLISGACHKCGDHVQGKGQRSTAKLVRGQATLAVRAEPAQGGLDKVLTRKVSEAQVGMQGIQSSESLTGCFWSFGYLQKILPRE